MATEYSNRKDLWVRWEDNIKADRKEVMCGLDWIHVTGVRTNGGYL
jgi:hypothetical protein